ncbi:MAG: hypothetical protein LM590_00720 [Thermofilum sp.]|jgi:CopG family nickel-responsive transcriptional regulator|nr:hypothetical protein [Thermofilum sp.]
MTRKKRFGVSVDKEVYEELTCICNALHTDRSHIVNTATKLFLLEKFHYAKPHKCEGVMIISYTQGQREAMSGVFERYRLLIIGRSHYHTSDDCCLEVLFVRGESGDILSLEKEAENYSVTCKFVPCHKL